MRLNRLTKAALIGVTAAGAAYVLAQKKKAAALNEAPNTAEIHGFVNPDTKRYARLSQRTSHDGARLAQPVVCITKAKKSLTCGAA
jgi:hypothetical protein